LSDDDTVAVDWHFLQVVDVCTSVTIVVEISANNNIYACIFIFYINKSTTANGQ